MRRRHISVAVSQQGGFEDDRTFQQTLMRRWGDRDFEPKACASELEALLAHPRWHHLAPFFDPSEVAQGGVAANPDFIYHSPDEAWSIEVVSHLEKDAEVLGFEFDRENGHLVGEAVRGLVDLRAPIDEVAAACAIFGDDFLPALQQQRATHAKARTWRPADRPGIYRREHGCAVIRSRTTSLMLDPLCFWSPYAAAPRGLASDDVAAVLITHSHWDHWNIASILHATGSASTPVVVPHVPRRSLLSSSDMHDTLTMFGQNVLDPAWGTTLTFGDIQVDILPFYGEQPTRSGPRLDDDLRNWGNCYRFTTEDFSAVALIDSGVDVAGDMAVVMRESVARRGAPDAIMSSLPRFLSPFFAGLPSDFLVIPSSSLQTLYGQLKNGTLPSVTPGPEGVVSLCKASEARFYLPYGNGFEGLDSAIEDVGISMGEPSEKDAVAMLAASLRRDQIATRPVSWNPGDAVVFDKGAATLLQASARSSL